MKRITLALVALAVISIGSARAQYEPRDPMDQDETTSVTPAKDRYIRKEVDKLTRQLDLTAQQQGAIRAALEKKREKRNEPLAESTRQDILSVLTPEQRVKFDQMKSDRYRPIAEEYEGMPGRDTTIPAPDTGPMDEGGFSPSTGPASTPPNATDMPPAGP